MNDLEVHALMGEALVSRGLATAEDVAADRATLAERLGNGEPANAQMAAQPEVEASAGAQTITTQTSAALSPGINTPQAQPDPLDEISAVAFAGPDTPAGYKFDRLPQGVQHSPEQELAVRSVFHEFGVPVAIAAQVDRMYSQAIQNPPTPQQMTQTEQQTHMQLHRAYGADAEKVLEVARREFRSMAAKQPILEEMMDVSGLGNSFYVISSLYQNARAKSRA